MIHSRRLVNLLIIGSMLIPLILTGAYYFKLVSLVIFRAWLAGWLIVFMGFVFELLLVRRGLGATDKSFMRNVLGAVSIRLFTTVLLVVICLVFLEFNQNNFIFSILIFYFFYIIIEIFYLNFRNY